MANNELIAQLPEKIVEKGAFKAAFVPISEVKTDVIFRTMCESNACGKYGKCWTCPPDAGNIHDLINSLQAFSRVLVYQTVSELEDSFDIEGMYEAGNRHNKLLQSLMELYNESTLGCQVMHLGAGGCKFCERCAKEDGIPCRFPDKAVSSLETYGINVSELAKSGGMKYINGQDTVTYFGAIFIAD